MDLRTVRASLRVGGTLVDATTALLRNQAGTAGIVRNDTGVVVVAANVALTKESTGVYSHTFTEPAASVAYTAYIQFVYNGNTYRVEKLLPARAASTDLLGITFMSLRVIVADYLGLGRNSEGEGTTWTAENEIRLAEIINSGYRQFLYPPILPGENTAHNWYFLRPVETFATVAETYAYDMPAAFGSVVGDVLYDEDENIRHALLQVSPALIDRNRAVSNASGRPSMFALRPKSTDQSAPQETEMMLYPTPDAAYDLLYYYDARVIPLSSDNPYPLGGQEHDECLIQSCLDIAESRMRDNPGGMQHELFMQRLQASIDKDRRNAPQFIGYNDDRTGAFCVTRHGGEFTCSLKHNLGGG